jgi:hypothetical protein
LDISGFNLEPENSAKNLLLVMNIFLAETHFGETVMFPRTLNWNIPGGLCDIHPLLPTHESHEKIAREEKQTHQDKSNFASKPDEIILCYLS